MTLFTVANRLQGLISTIILARLLVPEDFGIIAMAMSMIAGVELLTAVGLEVVLIQHPDPRSAVDGPFPATTLLSPCQACA